MKHFNNLAKPKATVAKANIFDNLGDWFDDQGGNGFLEDIGDWFQDLGEKF